MGQPPRAAGIEIELETGEPFDPEWLLGFFARRAVAGVEEMLPEGGYRRSVRLAHGAGVIELRPAAKRIAARLVLDDQRDRAEAEWTCRRLLDLDADPQAILAALGGDQVIGGLVRAAPGRRVPGTSDGHELAIRAVLGQQVSLASAATLAARLTVTYGERLANPVGAVTHLFPAAAAVARADPGRLAMPGARGRALLGLAAALARGQLSLDAERDPGAVRRELLLLRGIGPWTTEYIAMRALRDADAFMPTDLGVKHALARLGLDARPKLAAKISESWRPYRAYAMQHLWAQL